MEQIEKIQGTEKEFIKVFQELCYSRSSWQVWSDLMAAMACTLANSVDKTEPRYTAREKEYAECIKRLGGVEKPAKCFAIVVEALERNPDQDFLGKLYMSLELGNHWKGQFFTPYNVCECMASITINDNVQTLEKQEWISVNDPACGAGATLVAAANIFHRKKINYQTRVLFTANDIDRVVAQMCYIQLSLLGCAGWVAVANTIEFLEDNRVNAIEFNASQRTVLGTLGIGKIQYNMLRKLEDPAIRDLEILRYKPDLKWEEFNDLRYIRDNGHIDMYKKYIDLMAYTTLHKIIRYISEQKLTTRDNDYFDYTGWLEEMGYDMRNEFNLFPKDFQKMHDSMSKLYIKFKDEQSREEEKKFNLLLKKLRKDTVDVEAMNLNIEGLFIRLPKRLEELKVEGETLHHCVGTYMGKVRRGETMIFFIRKKEEPDKPYYTLEWRGKVIQCRGSHNCNMTSEVKAFVQIFQEKMMEYESKPKRQRKAG